jgi:hypothetical protein
MAVALQLVQDEDAVAEARRCKRSRVMLSATMTTAAAELPVVIRDISASGALVTSPVAPDAGAWVTLRRDPVHVHAQVVWRDGARIGLSFRDLVDEAALLVSLGRKPALRR